MLTIACALGSATCHAHLCRVDAELAPFLSAHLVFAVTLAIPLLMFRAVGCRMATHAIPFDIAFSRIRRRQSNVHLRSSVPLPLSGPTQETC